MAHCTEQLIANLVTPGAPLMTRRGVTTDLERREDANARVTRIIEHGADLDRVGATATAERLDAIRVPLLPEAEVSMLDELLAEIEARRELAWQEADTLDDL